MNLERTAMLGESKTSPASSDLLLSVDEHDREDLSALDSHAASLRRAPRLRARRACILPDKDLTDVLRAR